MNSRKCSSKYLNKHLSKIFRIQKLFPWKFYLLHETFLFARSSTCLHDVLCSREIKFRKLNFVLLLLIFFMSLFFIKSEENNLIEK